MEKIKIDDFAKITYLANPTFSPDGKKIAYTVTNANMEKNCYDSYIYVKKGNKNIKLTNQGHEMGFEFFDKDTIIFQSDRGDSKVKGSKFYTISLNGGEAELKFEFPIGVRKMNKLKNGNYIIEGQLDPRFPDLYKGNPDYAKKAADYYQEEADYETIEENPWWWNGSTFTRGMKGALYYYETKKNKLTLITDPKIAVQGFFMKEDESVAFFKGSEAVGYKDFEKSQLYKFDVKTLKYELVIPEGSKYSFRELFFVGNKIIALANQREWGMNTNPDFYEFDPNTYEFKLVCKFGEAIGSTVGSDVRFGGGNEVKVVGDTLYFITTSFDDAYLYSYKDGKITEVITKPGSIDSFDIYNDKLVMVALYDMKAQELYNESLNQITKFNDKFLAKKYVATPEQFTFKGVKDELHGFVLKPINYEPGKKYPVIIDIHGGPKTVYGPVFYHEQQYWASEGFFVVYTNPTGSDGRGNEFADICGKYGTIDYEDLMIFCDEVIKRYPDIDSERFFETGGSYGGFMTNWIIGHTNRFKACASQRSISNWFSFYGVSDIGVGFAKDQQNADPFESPEALWDRSPMKYAANCKTPTLFIHSNEDYRCPMPEGMQMLTSLLAHGVEAKMIYFKGENHELSRSGKPKHRVKRLNEITMWFKNHM